MRAQPPVGLPHLTLLDPQALSRLFGHVRALIIPGVVLLAACGGSSPTDSEDGAQDSYRNEVWGWSAAYPQGWLLEDENPAVIKLTAPLGGGDVLIGVISADWHPSAGRVEMLVALVASYEESLAGIVSTFKELSRRQFTTSALMPAAEVLYELGFDGSGTARLVIITTTDRRVVTFNVETDAETFALLEPGFDLLIDSFKAE